MGFFLSLQLLIPGMILFVEIPGNKIIITHIRIDPVLWNKVLIVEDSPSQAAVISTLVKEAGYDVSVYHEVRQGITQILLKEQP